MLASGYVLTNGLGVIDPCETGDVDVFNDMTLEMRNIVTLAAQTCLRSMNYGKLELYLSDPEALNNPDAARFGYGNDEDFEQQLNEQMERDIAAYTGEAGMMQPRIVMENQKEAKAADDLIGQEHKDEIDDAIGDFMKDL